MGLGVEERDPLAYLPSELEAVAGDARRVSVEEALRRLLAARKALVASMEPHEVLEVAALREASVRRIRAAVEMLHAPDDPSSALLPPPTLPPWPSRIRNSA
mmetsp:Transcript_41972/g.136670  ORF Transcript_41972/g.136670 Transcript_41972/m.136670 type:complete len:102 (-) Transcript_41972:110-415(-)